MADEGLLLAKRFRGERPGLDLLGVEKAAVPVTVVAADVLAQEVKPLPLLEEFVLRLLKADVGEAGEIAAFLGLERKLVDAVVADQLREGALLTGPGAGRLTLTNRGKRLAEELESVRPIQRNFKIAFDRLTWSVADYDSRNLVTKANALADGCLLLPAQRTTRVKIADITPDAVNSLLRQPGRAVSIDVLDVIDVSPSIHRYLPVHLLVFGDQDRGEIETAIVVDGDQSSAHDAALGNLGGAERLGLRIERSAPHAPLRAQLEAERVRPAPGALFEENSQRVRGVDLFQHLLIVTAALESAKNRVLIATETATRSVVDGGFVSTLEGALRRRVRVDLVVPRCANEVVRELAPLERWSKGRLTLHRPNSAVANTLIFDSYWAVSDFPWLSYRGAARPFRDFEGTLVAIPDEVDREYDAVMATLREESLTPLEPQRARKG